MAAARLFGAALAVAMMSMFWQNHHSAAAETRPDEGPSANRTCRARAPFCARGRPGGGGLPVMQLQDVLVVYLVRFKGLGQEAPALSELESHFPGLLGLGNSYREAVVFYSNLMARNFTLSWDPLFGVSSGASPILPRTGDPIWCNVGASCFAETDDSKLKTASVLKVAEMTGDNFNRLAAWVHERNATASPFDLWTVYNASAPKGAARVFDARDSNAYVQSVVRRLADIGVDFAAPATPRRSRVALYSEAATSLGNGSDIFGTGSKKQQLADDMRRFFNNFRPGQSRLEKFRSLANIFVEVVFCKRFFVHRDDTYWQLRMVSPYISVTDEPWHLPNATIDLGFSP